MEIRKHSINQTQTDSYVISCLSRKQSFLFTQPVQDAHRMLLGFFQLLGQNIDCWNIELTAMEIPEFQNANKSYMFVVNVHCLIQCQSVSIQYRYTHYVYIMPQNLQQVLPSRLTGENTTTAGEEIGSEGNAWIICIQLTLTNIKKKSTLFGHHRTSSVVSYTNTKLIQLPVYYAGKLCFKLLLKCSCKYHTKSVSLYLSNQQYKFTEG